MPSSFYKRYIATGEKGVFNCMRLSLMPEHVHLLFTPAEDITLERTVQLIKGGTRTNSELSLDARKKFGREGLPIIAYGMREISQRIVNIFIRIRLRGNWWNTRVIIDIVPHSPDSNWMDGLQRLKPRD